MTVRELTNEQKAALRHRQMHCTHSFIKQIADTVRTCVWCGVTQPEWERMKGDGVSGWAPYPPSVGTLTGGQTP